MVLFQFHDLSFDPLSLFNGPSINLVADQAYPMAYGSQPYIGVVFA